MRPTAGKQVLDVLIMPLIRPIRGTSLLKARNIIFLVYFPFMGALQGPIFTLVVYYGAGSTWWIDHKNIFVAVELFIFQLVIHKLFVPPYRWAFFKDLEREDFRVLKTRHQFHAHATELFGEMLTPVFTVAPSEVAAAYAAGSAPVKDPEQIRLEKVEKDRASMQRASSARCVSSA